MIPQDITELKEKARLHEIETRKQWSSKKVEIKPLNIPLRDRLAKIPNYKAPWNKA